MPAATGGTGAAPWPPAGARDALPAPARLAAALLAVDPVGLGGVRLRDGAGPRRDAWVARLRALLPEGTPWARMPLHIGDDRLLGGLDLGATLAQRRPVLEWGLLARTHGGVLVVPMAERLTPGMATRLTAALDRGEVVLHREGFSATRPAELTVLALDEGEEGEQPPAPLCERLGLSVDLASPAVDADGWPDPGPAEVAQARVRLPRVQLGDAQHEVLAGAAAAFGVASLRGDLFAARAARACAALAGRDVVTDDDLALAVQMVLLPRATRVPADLADEPEAQEPPAPEEPPDDRPDDGESAPPPPSREEIEELADRVIAAVMSSLPHGLLEQLRAGPPKRTPTEFSGRRGARSAARLRGRVIGVRAGTPRDGARLALLDTLRAAAPWQRLRRAQRPADPTVRVEVRRDDLRVTRHEQQRTTTTLFVVDASGSAALHRMAEAKGAVELLLADCYARRDRVALVAFRGKGAQLLLPPTRSLVRARRSLASLPGGGGTPVAAGLDLAREVVEAAQHAGSTPLLVLLTDGRANVGRDGLGGREKAEADAIAAARQIAATQCAALLIDTAPQPAPAARRIAEAMRARYLALPYASSATVSAAVRGARG